MKGQINKSIFLSQYLNHCSNSLFYYSGICAEKQCPDTSNTCFEISSPEYPDAYIITETSFPANDINKNAGSLGSVSVTVFVEETYDYAEDINLDMNPPIGFYGEIAAYQVLLFHAGFASYLPNLRHFRRFCGIGHKSRKICYTAAVNRERSPVFK